LREHEVEDDQKLEELHKAAVEGKLREKRRNRGLDLDDGSESEEDQRSVWHRRNKHKRRRTDDTLDNLGWCQFKLLRFLLTST
jgi:mediator of replication checkpoint protein 1